MDGDWLNRVMGWTVGGILFVGLCLYAYTRLAPTSAHTPKPAGFEVPCSASVFDEPDKGQLCKRSIGWS